MLLVALRGDIDPDYSNYKEIFDYSKLFLQQGGTEVEIGYLFLNSLVKTIGLGFQVIIFIMALLSVVPKAVFFYRYSPNYLFTLLIYFSSIYFLFDFIAIRQAVTLSIFMWSLVYIVNRRFIPFALCILFGSFIHVSILLLIPGYFIFHRKIPVKVLLAIVAICGIVNVLQIRVGLLDFLLERFVLPDGAAGKVAIYGLEQEFAFVSIKQIILAILFIYLNHKKGESNQFVNMLTNIFVAGIFTSTILNGIPQLSYRVKWYFFWPEAILILNFVNYLSFKKLSVKFLLFALLTLFYANTLNDLLKEISSRGDYIYPYKTFLEF